MLVPLPCCGQWPFVPSPGSVLEALPGRKAQPRAVGACLWMRVLPGCPQMRVPPLRVQAALLRPQ